MGLSFAMIDRFLAATAIGVYLVALAWCVRIVLTLVLKARRRLAETETQIDVLSQAVRRTARLCWAMKREARLMEEERTVIERDLLVLGDAIDVARSRRRPVFVFGEARRPEDRLFEIDVTHDLGSPVPVPFADGLRSYVLWASSATAARGRVVSVFRPEDGYEHSEARARASMPVSA